MASHLAVLVVISSLFCGFEQSLAAPPAALPQAAEASAGRVSAAGADSSQLAERVTAAQAATASAVAAASAAKAADVAAKTAQAAVAVVNKASAAADAGAALAGAVAANRAATQAANAASAATSAAAVATAQADRATSMVEGKTETAIAPPQVGAALNPVTTAAAAALRGSSQLTPALLPSWSEHPMQRMWALFAGLSFAVLIKGMCLAGNVLVQVSPYPTVKRWEDRSCTGEADAAPYISIAYNGWQWCYYGFFAYLLTGRSGFLILVQSNCLGAILGSYYAYTFYRNCKNPAARACLQKYLTAVTMLAGLQACAAFTLPLPRALFFSGLVSSFCSFLGALSMLVTVPMVLRTQNSRSIPGPLVVTNFASAVVWTMCGLMLADPLVTGPNIFCAAASAVCIFLRVRFPADESGKLEGDATPSLAKASSMDGTPFAKTMEGYGGKTMEGYSGASHCGPAQSHEGVATPVYANPTAAGTGETV